MNLKKVNLSRFYPGSIWFKRFGYLLLIYSIGTNCFLGKVQNKIFDEIEIKAEKINTINKLIENNQFPDLSSFKIDKDGTLGKAYEKGISWVKTTTGIEILSIDRINKIVNASKDIHEGAQKVNVHLIFIKKSLETVLFIITITSNLIWISIIWALIWLYFDIRKGNARGFVKKGLLLSIPFNVATFHLLSKYVLEVFISN